MPANDFPDRMIIKARTRFSHPEHEILRATLFAYLTSGDPDKVRSAVQALTDFVRTFCRDQRRIFVRSRPFDNDPLVVIDGHVTLYAADLDRQTDLRNILAERIEACTLQLKDEGEYQDLINRVYADPPEGLLFRLRRIEQLVQHCIEHSSPFVSAWEFDNHDVRVDPEAWHRELGQLLGLRALDDRGSRIFVHAGEGI